MVPQLKSDDLYRLKDALEMINFDNSIHNTVYEVIRVDGIGDIGEPLCSL